MIRLAVLTLLILTSCRSPDSVRVGVGHRQEHLGPATYGGQTAWVEGEWKLSSAVIEYGPNTQLFLSQQGAHRAAHDSTAVTVNVPAGEKKPDEPSTIDQLGKLGKDKDGDWSPVGAAVVLGIVAIGAVYALRRQTKKVVQGDA